MEQNISTKPEPWLDPNEKTTKREQRQIPLRYEQRHRAPCCCGEYGSQGRWNLPNLFLGLIAAFGFFVWGYVIDGGISHD
jgi:hypothetical protein